MCKCGHTQLQNGDAIPSFCDECMKVILKTYTNRADLRKDGINISEQRLKKLGWVWDQNRDVCPRCRVNLRTSENSLYCNSCYQKERFNHLNRKNDLCKCECGHEWKKPGPIPKLCDRCVRKIITSCITRFDLKKYEIDVRRARRFGWNLPRCPICHGLFKRRSRGQVYCSICIRPGCNVQTSYHREKDEVSKQEACKVVQCEVIHKFRDVLFEKLNHPSEDLLLYNSIRVEFMKQFCGKAIHRGAIAGAIFFCISHDSLKQIIPFCNCSHYSISKYVALLYFYSKNARKELINRHPDWLKNNSATLSAIKNE